jgi:RNA polymerase sigma-70 factor (ECF subfamily)
MCLLGSRPLITHRRCAWFATWHNPDVDPEVLQRFRVGDEAAVKAVYDRFGGSVFALSMSILGEHGLAADATQQTFIKAWRAASTYDPERSFAPWIYAIARRTAIDIYRKQIRVVVSDEIEIAVYPPGLETAWEVFEVRSALDQLPDEERQVVKLSHLDGFTHVEISKQLDIPVGTVKSRSHRAHQRLAELLRHVEEA